MERQAPEWVPWFLATGLALSAVLVFAGGEAPESLFEGGLLWTPGPELADVPAEEEHSEDSVPRLMPAGVLWPAVSVPHPGEEEGGQVAITNENPPACMMEVLDAFERSQKQRLIDPVAGPDQNEPYGPARILILPPEQPRPGGVWSPDSWNAA